MLIVFLFTVLYYGTISEEVDIMNDDTNPLLMRRKRYLDESLVDFELLNSPDIESYSDLKSHIRDKRDKMRLDELEKEYSLCKKKIPKEDKGCMKTFYKMYKLAKEISEKMDSMKKMFHDSEVFMTHDSADTSYEKYADIRKTEKPAFDWMPTEKHQTTARSVRVTSIETETTPFSEKTTKDQHSSSTNYEASTSTPISPGIKDNADIIRGTPSKEVLDVSYGGCVNGKSRNINHTQDVATLIFNRANSNDDCHDDQQVDDSIENLVDPNEQLPSTKSTTTRSIKPNETTSSEEHSSEEHYQSSTLLPTKTEITETTISHGTSNSATDSVYNISESTTTISFPTITPTTESAFVVSNNTTQEYAATESILATNMTTETTPYESSTYSHSRDDVVTKMTTEMFPSNDSASEDYSYDLVSTILTTSVPVSIDQELSTTESSSTIDINPATTDSSSNPEINPTTTTDALYTPEMKESSQKDSTSTAEKSSSTDSSLTTELNPSKLRSLDEEKMQQLLIWKQKFEDISAKHNEELEALLSQVEPGALNKAGIKVTRVNTELIGESFTSNVLQVFIRFPCDFCKIHLHFYRIVVFLLQDASYLPSTAVTFKA